MICNYKCNYIIITFKNNSVISCFNSTIKYDDYIFINGILRKCINKKSDLNYDLIIPISLIMLIIIGLGIFLSNFNFLIEGSLIDLGKSYCKEQLGLSTNVNCLELTNEMRGRTPKKYKTENNKKVEKGVNIEVKQLIKYALEQFKTKIGSANFKKYFEIFNYQLLDNDYNVDYNEFKEILLNKYNEGYKFTSTEIETELYYNRFIEQSLLEKYIIYEIDQIENELKMQLSFTEGTKIFVMLKYDIKDKNEINEILEHKSISVTDTGSNNEDYQCFSNSYRRIKKYSQAYKEKKYKETSDRYMIEKDLDDKEFKTQKTNIEKMVKELAIKVLVKKLILYFVDHIILKNYLPETIEGTQTKKNKVIGTAINTFIIENLQDKIPKINEIVVDINPMENENSNDRHYYQFTKTTINHHLKIDRSELEKTQKETVSKFKLIDFIKLTSEFDKFIINPLLDEEILRFFERIICFEYKFKSGPDPDDNSKTLYVNNVKKVKNGEGTFFRNTLPEFCENMKEYFVKILGIENEEVLNKFKNSIYEKKKM